MVVKGIFFLLIGFTTSHTSYGTTIRTRSLRSTSLTTTIQYATPRAILKSSLKSRRLLASDVTGQFLLVRQGQYCVFRAGGWSVSFHSHVEIGRHLSPYEVHVPHIRSYLDSLGTPRRHVKTPKAPTLHALLRFSVGLPLRQSSAFPYPSRVPSLGPDLDLTLKAFKAI